MKTSKFAIGEEVIVKSVPGLGYSTGQLYAKYPELSETCKIVAAGKDEDDVWFYRLDRGLAFTYEDASLEMA